MVDIFNWFNVFVLKAPTGPVRACPAPIAPPNGNFGPNQVLWTTGNTVTYTCNTGFVLNGSPIATCQADGTYTSNPPTCQGRLRWLSSADNDCKFANCAPQPKSEFMFRKSFLSQSRGTVRRQHYRSWPCLLGSGRCCDVYLQGRLYNLGWTHHHLSKRWDLLRPFPLLRRWHCPSPSTNITCLNPGVVKKRFCFVINLFGVYDSQVRFNVRFAPIPGYRPMHLSRHRFLQNGQLVRESLSFADRATF